MNVFQGYRKLSVVLCALLALMSACRKAERESSSYPDRPRLSPNVVVRDVTFYSASLNRDMPCRVVMPASIPTGVRFPVVYLLHGGAGDFRDWTNYSDVARFAERGLILVMPDGDESYYTNSADHPDQRYEDYIVKDLIADVEARFPVASDRAHRAIAGVSMGGFGAVKLSLKHPELFSFAAGFSSAIDVPNRPFSIRRIGQWRQHRSIFGPPGGATQRANDPFVLAESADPAQVPYLYLTCGDAEGLLPSNRSFAHLLEERHFAHEFHAVHGGHNWNQWNARLDDCFDSLLKHLGTAARWPVDPRPDFPHSLPRRSLP
jgi:putative tributyrin esterase